MNTHRRSFLLSLLLIGFYLTLLGPLACENSFDSPSTSSPPGGVPPGGTAGGGGGTPVGGSTGGWAPGSATQCSNNQVPSFLGAEGFGACATGGRGGQVLSVTNLNSTGPGSLQAALDTPGPRYILFKVSGVIDVTARFSTGDVTLAGQTSPGGVILRGLVCDNVFDPNRCNNLIIRHLRIRPGLGGNANDDGVRIEGAQNVILDHISIAQATDETVQISRSQNLTIQNSILAEPVGDHFYLGGMLINYSAVEFPLNNLSIHHNLWTRLGGRLPEISCEENGSDMGLHSNCTNHRLALELSNNLLFDPPIEIYYNRCTGTNEGNDCPPNGNSQFVDMNWVNNLMTARNSFDHEMMIPALSETPQNALYFLGNQIQRAAVIDYTPVGGISRPARHDFPGVTYHPTAQLNQYLRDNAGAFPHDPMDQRLIGYLTQNINSIPPASGNNAADAFSLNFDPSHPPSPPTDTDQDGMPDAWEISHGLNPNSADHNGTELSTQGYTNLDVYLNERADQRVAGGL